MLTSFVLTLACQKNVVLPPYVGRAHHAATLERIGHIDPETAHALHDGQGVKPLVCSSWLRTYDKMENITLKSGETVDVRVTSLSNHLTDELYSVLIKEPPDVWCLTNHKFRVATVTCNSALHPWAGSTTLTDLAAKPILQQKQLKHEVTLHFSSPTCFKSQGRHIPLPSPDLVFGSLADRWNALSPLLMAPEMRKFSVDSIALTNYQARTVSIPMKEQGIVTGFVGRATYRLVEPTADSVATLHQLADFAFYSGVGVKTALGLGQCRKLG